MNLQKEITTIYQIKKNTTKANSGGKVESLAKARPHLPYLCQHILRKRVHL